MKNKIYPMLMAALLAGSAPVSGQVKTEPKLNLEEKVANIPIYKYTDYQIIDQEYSLDVKNNQLELVLAGNYEGCKIRKGNHKKADYHIQAFKDFMLDVIGDNKGALEFYNDDITVLSRDNIRYIVNGKDLYYFGSKQDCNAVVYKNTLTKEDTKLIQDIYKNLNK